MFLVTPIWALLLITSLSFAITFNQEPKGNLLSKIHKHIVSIKKREVENEILKATGTGSLLSFPDEDSKIYKETRAKFEDQRHRRYVIRRKNRNKRDLDKAEPKFLTIGLGMIIATDLLPFINELIAKLESLKREVPCNWPKCYSTLVKAIFMKHANPPSDFPSSKDRLWFNVSSLNGFTLEKATVTFFTGRLRDDFGDIPLLVRVYRYKSKENDDYEEYLTTTIERDLDDFTDDNWQTVDITEIVKRWIIKQTENYGIRLEVTPVINSKEKKEFMEVITDRIPSAFIEITNAEKKLVDRRTLKPYNREITDRCTVLDGSRNETCCRYPFEINFDDYGWDWIIAPKTLTLYYCAGTCGREKQENSPHTLLLKLSNHGINCCSPDDAGPVNIMYVDKEGNYQVKAIPGLLVARCRCR